LAKKFKKYATAITIGCRLNQADTALIFDRLKKRGYEIVKSDTKEHLSLIIINTCSVTSSASQKSRQAARSFRKKNPNALIIVTGCSVDIESDFWKNESSVNLIIPNSFKTRINSYLDKLEAKTDLSMPKLNSITEDNINTSFVENAVGYYPFKSRANIKIQEGCDSFCSYCIVPYGRGKPQFRDWDDAIREFKALLKRGHREIILTGVNIATYNNNGKTLADLLRKLISIPGNFRIRLSSTEPQFNTHELIDIISSSPKICRFLHLPLQHGTNKILKRMGRNYSIEDFAEFVNRAVVQIPGICIGTDIIIGFPGETDELFSQCLTFLKRLPLSYLHIFRYSKRKGTPAADYIDQVPHNIALKRHNILSEIGKELSNNLLTQQLGKTVKVLFEKYNSNNELVGWSDNYIKIKVDHNKVKCFEASPQLLHQWLNNFADVQVHKITGQREAKGIIRFADKPFLISKDS
jgi:threonylcarbamoyladenosine tRNA methylthiotransferase MtaB